VLTKITVERLKMNKKISTFLVLVIILFSQVGESKNVLISPTKNDHEMIQEALILLQPGDSLTMLEGIYQFEDGLSLDVDNVTIKGEGKDKTILSFKDQVSGAQGLLVTSDGVILKDFAIEDAKGDALKVIGANGIYMINIRTEWTGGPKSTNGAYGLYPVESKNVLIDGCVAIGASDAGI
ncbi:uncharacterized protein METZ01_LOCUS418024, partial [marine metagenome]